MGALSAAVKTPVVCLPTRRARPGATVMSDTTVPLMLTVPVRGESDLVEAARLADVADYLLLDWSHPLAGIVGATGLVHDWDVSARIVTSAPRASQAARWPGYGPTASTDPPRVRRRGFRCRVRSWGNRSGGRTRRGCQRSRWVLKAGCW